MKCGAAIGGAAFVAFSGVAFAQEDPNELREWLRIHPEWAADCIVASDWAAKQPAPEESHEELRRLEIESRWGALMRKTGNLDQGEPLQVHFQPASDWPSVFEFWSVEFKRLVDDVRTEREIMANAERNLITGIREHEFVMHEFVGACSRYRDLLNGSSPHG